MKEHTEGSTTKVPPEIKDKVNNVKNRILFLSPSVVSGDEREAKKDDFESLSNANIGVGGFGRVYKVKHKVSKNIYAIKVINKAKIIENELKEQIKLEVDIMYRLDHPHIIKLYNHFEDDDSFYLILEYASKGQLYTKLKTLGRLDEKVSAQYIREVVSAVEYLHSLNPPIIHRDIKPENILLDSKEAAKLCDFGWSNFFNEKRKRMTYCGTPEYLAPEMIKQAGHDESLDYWNIGVLAFELLTGRPPFEGNTQKELYENILKAKISFPKDFPKYAKDLVSRLLKTDPKERIKSKEVSEHAWFKANSSIRPLLDVTKEDGKDLPKDSPMKYEVVSKKSEESQKPQDVKKFANQIADKKGEERDKIIEELSNKYQNSAKDLNDLKISYQSKINEIEKLKNENSEYKKDGTEISNKGFAPEATLEIRRLNDEIGRHKNFGKNKDEIITDIAKRQTQITEQEGKIKTLQMELDQVKKEKNQLNSKIDELGNKNEKSEKDYKLLKQADEETKIEKEKAIFSLENQLETIQLKMLSKTEDSEHSSGGAVSEVIRSILEEIKSKVGYQTQKKKGDENLKNELANIKEKIQKLNDKHKKDKADFQAIANKKIEDLKLELIEEQKLIVKREEAKIESLKKNLQNLLEIEEQSPPAQDGAEQTNFEKLVTQQKQQISEMQNQIETQGQKENALKMEITTLEGKISDLEYQYALLKDQAYRDQEIDGETS